MKRMITKQMRDSFNVSFDCRVAMWGKAKNLSSWVSVYDHFQSTKKQRILILRRTIK